MIATPIGNLEDLTHRAERVLREVDALACEDTRQTRKLLARYAVTAPPQVFSYHEHNEDRAGERILALLEEGRSVALCTDAGTPGISDPGYRIISACRERELDVQVLPGADAVSTALVASGLPTSSYTFRGFPPRKSSARRRFLESDRESPHTLVLFESPHRVAALLADAAAVLGDRMAAVCMELTKKFEQVARGYLTDLVEQLEGETIRGEVTVVIAGSHRKFVRSPS